MKEILIYPIKSMLHDKNKIDEFSKNLLESIENDSDFKFKIVENVQELNNHFGLILVQSGGSESIFLNEIFLSYNGPYYFLTYGENNSLAASLEILSFINNNNKEGEVLHGDISYIIERLNCLFEKSKNVPKKLGVFGTPSDWLISSNVDYNLLKDKFNYETILISNEELNETILRHIDKDYHYNFNKIFDNETLKKSYAIYVALKELIEKFNLSGFTIRCFDCLLLTKQTSCFALALFNSQGIVAACEGDVPCLVSAMEIRRLFNKSSFQANPQFIDPLNNIVEFAHCTIPLDMIKDYVPMTHYESNMGMGLKGEIYEGDCTVFKISNTLKEFYVSEGRIEQNEFKLTRCRTQVKVYLESDATYFLKSSLGNHHEIIYGRHSKELIDYLTSKGLRRVI